MGPLPRIHYDPADQLVEYLWIATEELQFRRGADGFIIRSAQVPNWCPLAEIVDAIHRIGLELLRGNQALVTEKARALIPFLVQRIIQVDPEQRAFLGEWEHHFPPQEA